jgi:protein-disulfide isomerase
LTTAATNPGPPAPDRGPNWGVLGLVVAVAALVVAGAAWQQQRASLDELRAGLRTVASEVAAMRQVPVIDLAGVPALGPDDAVVTLVEFSDYECPFCLRHFQQTMPLIHERYIQSGKIRYAFLDWPVDQLHPQAIRAHEAAHCAGEQQKYWDMHRRLFGRADIHTPQALSQLAAELGLDLPAFTSCIGSGRATEAIRATSQQAQDLGATGTPAFFIGERDLSTNQVRVVTGLTGAQPLEVFARALDDVIASAR